MRRLGVVAACLALIAIGFDSILVASKTTGSRLMAVARRMVRRVEAGSVDAASDASLIDSGAEGGATVDAGQDSFTSGTGGDGGEGDSALGDARADSSNAGSEPPSCRLGRPGSLNCGASGSESCCTSLEMGSGLYSRTYANDGGGPTGEADPASVTGLRLDKYDVTVGRFRQFVNVVLPPDGGTGWLPVAGAGKHTHLNQGLGLTNSGGAGTYEPGWVASDNSNIAPTNGNLACQVNFSTWTASAGSQENLPINCVNWWESYAFCIWDGGFLPSEAEWEYAAAVAASNVSTRGVQPPRERPTSTPSWATIRAIVTTRPSGLAPEW